MQSVKKTIKVDKELSPSVKEEPEIHEESIEAPSELLCLLNSAKEDIEKATNKLVLAEASAQKATNKGCDELKEQIEELVANLHAAEKEITDFRKKFDELKVSSDADISAKNAQLAAKNAQLADKNAQLANRNAVIDNLSARLNNFMTAARKYICPVCERFTGCGIARTNHCRATHGFEPN